jgi:hypothetical protein
VFRNIGGSNFTSVSCQPGERATGIGARFAVPLAADRIAHGEPISEGTGLADEGATPDGWEARGVNADPANARDFFVLVVCASP